MMFQKSTVALERCNACCAFFQELNEWCLNTFVQVLMFDTMASNTGLKMGNCTLLGQAVDKELAWIAGRHYVFEVMLLGVFSMSLCMGRNSGPDGGLLKCFQEL